MPGQWDRERLNAVVRWDVPYLPLEAIMQLLASVPSGALVDLVLGGGEIRYRRAVCARALVGRVPDEHATALADRGRDETVPLDVRNPILMSVLSMPDQPRSDDLLAWLRKCEIADRPGLSLNTSILLAHAISGDGGAVEALSAQAAAPSWGKRTDAEHAIEALIRSRGHSAVLSTFGVGSPESLAFHGTTPAERLLGLRLLWRADGDITPCLGDDSTMVARKAYDLCTQEVEPDPKLLAMVQERRPGYLWALAVLHQLCYEIRPMWEELGSPRVEVPGIPPDVREAIVRQYAPGERDTDPRWLIEAALLAPSENRDELAEQRLHLAVRALAAAGLEPGEPLSAGDAYRQGEGTFHIITTNAGTISVSTLGPFFRLRNDKTRGRTALQDAGFRDIGAELGATEFTGLHVYFFGRRDPLQVNDLLFYWQD